MLCYHKCGKCSCRFFLVLIFVVTILLPVSVQARITDMRTGSGPTRMRIVLDMDEPAKFKDSGDSGKIVLDLGTSVKKNILRKFNDASITDINLEKSGKNSSRLTVRLKKPAQHKVIVLKNPHRIVLDVYRIEIVKTSRELGNGLGYTFWQDDMNGLPVRLYVLSVSPDSGYYLKPFSGAVNRNGRGKLSRAAASVGARAAVNACYFDTDGWVIGNCKWNDSFYGVDSTPRSALVVDREGHASVQKTWHIRGLPRCRGARFLLIRE